MGGTPTVGLCPLSQGDVRFGGGRRPTPTSPPPPNIYAVSAHRNSYIDFVSGARSAFGEPGRRWPALPGTMAVPTMRGGRLVVHTKHPPGHYHSGAAIHPARISSVIQQPLNDVSVPCPAIFCLINSFIVHRIKQDKGLPSNNDSLKCSAFFALLALPQPGCSAREERRGKARRGWPPALCPSLHTLTLCGALGVARQEALPRSRGSLIRPSPALRSQPPGTAVRSWGGRGLRGASRCRGNPTGDSRSGEAGRQPRPPPGASEVLRLRWGWGARPQASPEKSTSRMGREGSQRVCPCTGLSHSEPILRTSG